MELTAAQSVTGKPRFSNKKGRKSNPSAIKEPDERARRKAILKQRPVVNYGKGKGKRLVQGQSDEARLSNRLYSTPEQLPKSKLIPKALKVTGQARNFGKSRA